MRSSSFLAFKFLSHSRFRWCLNSLGIIAFLGVLVSVSAFILVEALISGNREDMKNKILGFSAHASLSIDVDAVGTETLISKIKSHQDVLKVDHYLEGEVFLRTQHGDDQAIRVRGVENSYLKKHSNISLILEPEENISSLMKQSKKNPGILPGFQLLKDLRLAPFLMEEVDLVFPLGAVGPTGEFEPNVRRFRVIGSMKTGFYEYDSQYAFIDLEEARYLFGEQYKEKLAVFFKDPEKVAEYRSFLEALPGVVLVRTWNEQNARLFSALILERYAMMIILGLTLVLSTFNILSILWLIAHQRRREIALLKALGLSGREVSRLFYKMGFVLGCSGASLGVLLGWGLGLTLQKLGHWVSLFDFPYYLESLPVAINYEVMVLVWSGAVLLSVFASVLPAIEVRKIKMVSALHRLSE